MVKGGYVAPLKCFNPHVGVKLHGGARSAQKARKRSSYSDTNLEAGCCISCIGKSPFGSPRLRHGIMHV